ncbi:MBL fold metallo-hydrolase [Candidatus Gracilibacteria bacterium]|nr:MBL fold metallo-hydrolase [Candidatus Gracilibacteria bacterium]NJM85935.1 MBL fold metallo-hydrolase [Hydrococcus sp. RU_2_2]NJP17592.1 MBL fold metallo-hydrolase [Hydrococcus sp. CRU_1_1]
MKAKVSRRTFLTSAIGAAIAATVPFAWKSRVVARQNNAQFYRFKLGDFQMTSIGDGVLNVPAKVFAGNASPAQLSEVLQQGFQSEMLTLNCNILLVDTGTQKVLIDSGSGLLTDPTAGKLIGNLQTLQIQPTDIDAIIITHAHADHVGGLLDKSGALAFPQARYYISKAEYDFWTNPDVDLSNIQVDEKTKQQFISIAKKCLGAIQEKVTPIEGEREILPGFYAIPAPGHTAGQLAIRVVSGDASMVHTADVVHTHTINLWNPSWQPIFDATPDQAATTRQEILSAIASKRQLMYAYHFPFPGIGYLRPRSRGGFEWEPVRWQFES